MRLSVNLSDSRYGWATTRLPALLASAPSRLVFDIGAGAEMMRAPVQNSGGAWHGFDLVPHSPEVVRWDLDQACPEETVSAGVALMLDVLEHLDNPGLGLKNVARSLLPGGYLLLTMPNPRWSRSRFFALASGWPSCFTQADLENNHHVFTPWPHIVEWLLTDAGFAVEQYVTLDGRTAWPGAPFNWRYPARWIFAAMCRWIERRDATACGMSYGIVAQKVGQTTY
ncbi:MAG: methyltransferase domain-containing protein [Planctomycetes bacterium]|nr:methyltransferase domain-containing protein [Planctomycetota bacterium]